MMGRMMGRMMEGSDHGPAVPLWGRFEAELQGASGYDNPPQEARLRARFISPQGKEHPVEGFWDGGRTWRVRISPDEVGRWTYSTVCSDTANEGLHARTGEFTCSEPRGDTPFEQHGPLRLSEDRRYLVHADGTPFFWLADAAWSGPLRATQAEWAEYLKQRRRRGFSVVQFVGTHWSASPEGDEEGRRAYSGRECIAIHPAFYQRMERRLDALVSAGFLAAPMLLYAGVPADERAAGLNPGRALPEDQAILLARYMVARWGAYPVVWILVGDDDFDGERAGYWCRVGQAVFGKGPRALVTALPRAMEWLPDEILRERWLDIVGYQCGFSDGDAAWSWILAGPPAREWMREPARPVLHLQPGFEGSNGVNTGRPLTAETVRRVLYWSLLAGPPAGVSYGAHGIWNWHREGHEEPDYLRHLGAPMDWKQALAEPMGVEHSRHLGQFFSLIKWWRLRPAPDLLRSQPGHDEAAQHISAARSEDGKTIVVYTPEERLIDLRIDPDEPNLAVSWFNPRSGEYLPGKVTAEAGGAHCRSPAAGDWVLWIERP